MDIRHVSRQGTMRKTGMRISNVSTSSDGFLGFLLFPKKVHFFLGKGWLSFYSVQCYLTKVPEIGPERGR